MSAIIATRRYQAGLSTRDLYPERDDGQCRCGCGATLPGRRTAWATLACERAAVRTLRIIKGDGATIRRALWERDGGVCRGCGLVCEGADAWEADHIVPVEAGGGGCGLDGYQTLCVGCHREKTNRDRQTCGGTA